MRRLPLAAVAIAAAVGGPAAVAATDHGAEGPAAPPIPVAITYDNYVPQRLDVVTGDTVLWTNNSVRKHTVTADDGSFDSGTIAIGQRFSLVFKTAGEIPYHCVLHPFIRGEVDVHDVLLFPPAAPAGPGRPFPLSGRTSHEAGETVSIQAESADGFREVATTTVGASGAFQLDVTPATTTTYRAVVGDDASPSVPLLVLDRSVATAATRRGRLVTVRARVTPPSPRATVVLQLYLPHRFGWWPVQRVRLDSASRARFRLRLSRIYRARVLLTLPDGATSLGSSHVMRIGSTR